MVTVLTSALGPHVHGRGFNFGWAVRRCAGPCALSSPFNGSPCPGSGSPGWAGGCAWRTRRWALCVCMSVCLCALCVCTFSPRGGQHMLRGSCRAWFLGVTGTSFPTQRLRSPVVWLWRIRAAVRRMRKEQRSPRFSFPAAAAVLTAWQLRFFIRV